MKKTKWNKHFVGKAILSKASVYVNSSARQTKWMYFFIENDDLLEKCNNIWDKVNTALRRIWYQASPQESVSEKSKKKIMVMKLQIFERKKILKDGI